MTTLALDTTTEFGSIALISGDAVAAELLIHSNDERSGCRLIRGAGLQACHAGFRAGISNS